jgi:predicted metal-dependent peptidase
VRADQLITSREELEEYVKEVKLVGFGATDFRPAFEYVDELIRDKKFEDLKGLIYFTDGYGGYPSSPPKYEVIFACMNEDRNRLPVPGWAISTVVGSDQ